jgi:hypothetical protein
MPAAIGTKNNIGTRVERREKPSDLRIPYQIADTVSDTLVFTCKFMFRELVLRPGALGRRSPRAPRPFPLSPALDRAQGCPAPPAVSFIHTYVFNCELSLVPRH